MILLSAESQAHFEKDIESCMKKLTTSRDLMVEWLQVQLMWIYLEAVFSGGDISKYMTQETNMFGNMWKACNFLL